MKKRLDFFTIMLGCLLVLFGFINPSTSYSKNLGKTTFIPANDVNFVYLGRIDYTTPTSLRFSHTGVSIRFRFEGATCILHLKNKSQGKKNYYNVIVDKETPRVYGVSNEADTINIIGLSNGIHDITIFKRTEALVGEGIFEGVDIEKGKKLLPVISENTRKIEFIGNSITCGYGIEGLSRDCPFSPETENAYLAYGALTARQLNADYVAVAYSGRGVYRNYDAGTYNTMSLIYDRIFPDDANSPKWDPKKYQPDVLVVNLGTNDFAKGAPDSTIFVDTYINFLKKLRSYYPTTTIVCIEGPMISDYYPQGAMAFTKIKKYINAAKDKLNTTGDTKIHSFFLSRQGEGDYGCDWHPNLKRHKAMSEELTNEIKKIMNW